MKNWKYRSLVDVQEDIQTGKTSCEDLAAYYLNNCSKNKHLNAFLEVFEDEVISKAKELDQKIKAGTAGKLAGMFLAIKDNICYRGHVVSGSSKIIENYEAVYTSTALQRLLDEDVIVIGRCNCDEFAMGASNENSAYGPVLNADDNSRVPGGSSGGSAVAVQADMCLAALGSDTGGSIRQPASFTGTIGLKTTYGRVSRYGLLAYASSFDQIGPIAKSVSDAGIILEVMGGKDSNDATSSDSLVKPFAKNQVSGQKIGYIKEAVEKEGVDPEVKQAMMATVSRLQEEGHTVEAVSFPYLDYMVPCYYVLTTAEASSNLSRYSGILYGERSSESVDIESTFKKTRSLGFGEEVKRRIMTGTFVLSADYYEAYYTKALKVRNVIRQESLKLLESYDAIISPTTPSVAFKLNEKAADPIQMYLADIFTVQASLAGLPAVSVPIGRNSSNMSIGLHIMGNDFQENEILNLASVLLTLDET